jgi:hypothetical protein
MFLNDSNGLKNVRDISGRSLFEILENYEKNQKS